MLFFFLAALFVFFLAFPDFVGIWYAKVQYAADREIRDLYAQDTYDIEKDLGDIILSLGSDAGAHTGLKNQE